MLKAVAILEKNCASDVWLGSEYGSISYYTVNLTWLVFLPQAKFQWTCSFSINTISSAVVSEVVASITI